MNWDVMHSTDTPLTLKGPGPGGGGVIPEKLGGGVQKLLRLMLNCLAGKAKFVNFIFWSVNSQFRLYIEANLQRRFKQQNCYSSINIMQIAVFFLISIPRY